MRLRDFVQAYATQSLDNPWTLIGLIVFIAAASGCREPNSSSQPLPPIAMPLTQQSSEAEVTSAEQWQWMIDAVASGRTSSIEMDIPINNQMLEQLTTTTEAIELLLDAGVVDDSGLQIVTMRLPELEHLRIRLSPISNDGAKYLAGLKKLRIINLPQSKISREGILAWQDLPLLNHLRLSGAQIDDAVLGEIVKLPQLQSLHLIGPRISDEGLQQLASAKRLSSFYVDDCPLSEQAWEKLKKTRPDLHVHLDQVHQDR